MTNEIFIYMNAGLTVVATDTPEQRRIIEQIPVIGALCRMHDAQSLASAIDSLATDPYRLWEARHAARKGAEERFNWKAESLKLLELVARL